MKMRISARKSILASLLIATVLFVSHCTKTNNSGPGSSNYTITDIMKSSINATIFYKALTITGLDTVFKGTGPFTVFVPTDSAFIASGITLSTISSVPPSVVRDLILYHTIAGTLLYQSNFPAGPDARMVMANGDSTFVTNNSFVGFFVNGIPIRQSDILASNGVIQALTQSALLPPRGSLYQMIQSDTNFNYLVAAVQKASQGSNDLVTSLSNTNLGGLTLLAPVNAAFVNAGYPTVNDINNANPDSLANMIMYHMVGKRIFTSDLYNGESFVSTAEKTFYVTVVNNQWAFRGTGDTATSNLINANMLGHNGVLFVVDRLMKP